MKKLITICAVVGLIMTAAGTAQADLDINEIRIHSCKEHRNGTPDTYPWVFETSVVFDDTDSSLDHINVIPPAGGVTAFTISEISEEDGSWGYESPSCYLTLAALQADYPTGNYTFDFRNSSNELLMSVTVDFSGISEPTEAVNFTYPSTIGQTGIDINPTFTWTVSPAAGNTLGRSVWDVLTDESIYNSWGVPMTTPSWTPGPLLPNHEYGLEVTVLREGNPYDASGSIPCSLSIQYCNEIEFTTAALPSDNFNDNSMDTSLWNLYEDDHINAWLDETNARLEFRSTADASDAAALYIANDWGFLTTSDFSFKVDFHYSSTVTGSVLLGIRKDEESGENEVWLEAGYEEDYDPSAFFCWDASVNGNMVYGGDIGEYIKSRSLDDGTLYISYDASEDELYLSDTGYWADNAWGTLPGFVQGEWDADRVSLLLGGSSFAELSSGALPSGGAYLDNFVVDSGTIDLNINVIYINSCKDLLDGVPETSNPWVFEVWVEIDDPGSLHHIDVTKPGASTPFTTIYEVDGGWDYESPSRYLTLAALQADYPTGNYTFDFRNISDTLLNSITLDYSGISEPTEAVNFIYPSTIGQTGIDINPTFTWTVSPTAGNVLGMSVLDVLTDESVYESWGVPMTTTSWTPGPLLPNHEYELEVVVVKGKGGELNASGDEFEYGLSIEYDNEIEFTTATTCLFDVAGDLNDDCKVDFHDFVIMAANWLIDCNTNPSDPACVPK